MHFICSVKAQVDEVTSVMRENVNKLFARGDQLSELNERSENVRSVSDEFYSASSRLLYYFYYLKE